MNHKQVFHVHNVKTVELVNITNIDYDIYISDNSDEASYSDQHNMTHEDYFNNLLETAHSIKPYK